MIATIAKGVPVALLQRAEQAAAQQPQLVAGRSCALPQRLACLKGLENASSHQCPTRSVPLGSSGTATIFTIRNTGDEPLSVGAITLLQYRFTNMWEEVSESV